MEGPLMPPRKRIELPDRVRKAVLSEVKLSYLRALEADEESKIRMFLAVEQGLTTYDISERLEVPQQTVSRWCRQGREAWERREAQGGEDEPAGDPAPGDDPVRSAEPEPVC
jgi:DNA-directed RNA polymerase specialized sigma24 family protein